MGTKFWVFQKQAHVEFFPDYLCIKLNYDFKVLLAKEFSITFICYVELLATFFQQS